MEMPVCFPIRAMLAMTSLVGLASLSTAGDAPPSGELAEILGKWTVAVSEPKDFEIRGDRIVYNSVFEVETWSKINIRYHAPDSIRFESQPESPAEGTVSRRRSERTGQPYRIEPTEACLFIWDGRDVVICHKGTGKLVSEYVVVAEHQAAVKAADWPSPPAMPEDTLPWWQDFLVRAGKFYLMSTQSAFTSNGSEKNTFAGFPLFGFLLHPELLVPSIFAADSPEFMTEMDWTIAKRTTKTIQLEGRPNSQRLKAWFQSLDVILDCQTGRPLAQRTFDPSGNVQTVFTFKDWDTNPSPLVRNVDPRKWDYEIFPLPPEIELMKHRRAK